MTTGAGARTRAAAVIPALNEAASIERVVANVKPYADPIVVDDGSTDETAAIALHAGAHVVRHERNRGYDRALDTGFASAARLGYDFVVTLDADGQHDPERVVTFLDELARGADIVVGRRQSTQRISEKLFSIVARHLWRIDDPLCGMKAYRMSFFARVGHFDSYQSVGTELLIRGVRSGLKIAQVPVQTRRRDGRPRFGAGLRADYVIARALLIGLVHSRGIQTR